MKREIKYGEDYPVLSEALVKVRVYLEQKHPELSTEIVKSGKRERPGNDSDTLPFTYRLGTNRC